MRQTVDLDSGQARSGIGGGHRPRLRLIPLLARERKRLERLGGTSGAAIPDCLPNRAANLAAMREQMLAIGGHAVELDVTDPNTPIFLRQASYRDTSGLSFEFGRPFDCHRNSLELHFADPEGTTFVTGYAANEYGVWVRHSWVERSGGIVETTAPRCLYYGAPFSTAQTLLFTVTGEGLPHTPPVKWLLTRKDYVEEMHARRTGPGRPLEEMSEPRAYVPPQQGQQHGVLASAPRVGTTTISF